MRWSTSDWSISRSIPVILAEEAGSTASTRGVEGLAEEHALLVLGGVGELRRELLDGGHGSLGSGGHVGHVGRGGSGGHVLVEAAHLLSAATLDTAATAATTAAALAGHTAALGHGHVGVLHGSAGAHGAAGAGGHDGLEAKAGLGLGRAHDAGGRLAVVHGGTGGHAGGRHAVGHAGHAAAGDGALRKLSLEAHSAVLLALREGDVEGLGARHLAVHLGHRAGSLVRGGEGDERGAAAVE